MPLIKRGQRYFYTHFEGGGAVLIVVTRMNTGLTVDGHAGYAETGNDIVCAAVSILAQNLENSLLELTEDQILSHSWNGHMDIQWESLSEKGKLLVDSFFVGISALSDTYGEAYVKKIEMAPTGVNRINGGKTNEVQK